jgi:NTP pyrophosphatase (non-canonical NTP hydrolase)
MADLPLEPTLRMLQNYLAEVCQDRGWTKDRPPDKFVFFIEEVGELAKAIRKKSGLYSEAAKPSSFDLESAFRAKERVNESRIWH